MFPSHQFGTKEPISRSKIMYTSKPPLNAGPLTRRLQSIPAWSERCMFHARHDLLHGSSRDIQDYHIHYTLPPFKHAYIYEAPTEGEEISGKQGLKLTARNELDGLCRMYARWGDFFWCKGRDQMRVYNRNMVSGILHGSHYTAARIFRALRSGDGLGCLL